MDAPASTSERRLSGQMGTPPPRKKPTFLKIKDLTPALSDKECYLKVIVMESNAKDEALASGANATLLVGDDSGCASLVLPKSVAQHVRVGDIVQLLQTQLVLKSGRVYLWGGRVERVGDFTMLFKESHNVSNISWVPDPANPDTLVRAASTGLSIRVDRGSRVLLDSCLCRSRDERPPNDPNPPRRSMQTRTLARCKIKKRHVSVAVVRQALRSRCLHYYIYSRLTLTHTAAV
jgi:hypothetical protein